MTISLTFMLTAIKEFITPVPTLKYRTVITTLYLHFTFSTVAIYHLTFYLARFTFTTMTNLWTSMRTFSSTNSPTYLPTRMRLYGRVSFRVLNFSTKTKVFWIGNGIFCHALNTMPLNGCILFPKFFLAFNLSNPSFNAF